MSLLDLIEADKAGYVVPVLQKKINGSAPPANLKDNVPMSGRSGMSNLDWMTTFKNSATGKSTASPNTQRNAIDEILGSSNPGVTRETANLFSSALNAPFHRAASMSVSPNLPAALPDSTNDFNPVSLSLSGNNGLPPFPQLSALNTGVNTAQRWSGDMSATPLTPISSPPPQNNSLFGAIFGERRQPNGLNRFISSPYGTGSSFTPFTFNG